jgi:hypothetical protein
MSNEPVIVDNFLHIINQRKIVNLFESSEIHWTLAMFPSYGNRLAHLAFDKSDKQVWEDSPTLRHLLYIKDKETAISEQEKYVINLFQQGIEKQINSKIEIIRCMAIAVIPNPNFTAQCMMPHTDWIIPHETCIYYLNSTDGDTVLFDQTYDASLSENDNDNKKKTVLTKISPTQGKAVLFNGLQYHASNPSKTDLRFVLNINYVRV